MKTIAYVRATNVYDDSRATKEILSLAEAGYRVVVLAWDRNGKAQDACEQVFAQFSDRIDCVFYKKQAENGIGLKNLPKLVEWFGWVAKQLGRLEQLFCVHACNLDAGIGAYQFCKRKKIPLVYDIYDYYIDSHSIPPVLVPAVEKMEISIINYADMTIICTEERKEQISKASPKKLLVIHNSPDVDEVKADSVQTDYAYCGALGERRLVGEILGAYPEQEDLKMTFAGYGEYSGQAASLAECCDNFQFLGTIPYSRVLEVEAQARVIAAIYEPTIRNHRLCAPNKFYEALALSKPVIVCRGTGIDQIVEGNQIGMVIDYSAEEFYAALRYLKENPELCMEMGSRGRMLYEQNYRWSVMKEKLIKAYGEIV